MSQQMIECLKALGDPVRFTIYKRLQQGEVCACDFLSDLSVAQPTLSFHLKKMTNCGLIDVQKDGVRQRYTINHDMANKLKSIWDKTDHNNRSE